MEFKANTWSSRYDFVICIPGGAWLELDGHPIGFTLDNEAKRFARYLTESNFESIEEIQDFLKSTNMFQYMDDGRAKLVGWRCMDKIRKLIKDYPGKNKELVQSFVEEWIKK